MSKEVMNISKTLEKELIDSISKEICYEIDKLDREAEEAENNVIKDRFEILDL